MREDTSEKAYIPKYQSKKPVTILSADGAYCNISSEQSRILYFVNIPYLKEDENNNHAIEQLQKLLVEVRIPTSGLKHLVQSIIDDLEKGIEEQEETTPTDQIPLEVM